jgi:hypothetical protein
MKLQQLEGVLARRHGKSPTEAALAAAASMSRGEVRRYRKILNLPEKFKLELMRELEKPRGDQNLTVDQVLESTKGAEALTKRNIIDEDEREQLNQALVEKFRNKTIKNTVAPRKLARLARAVERNELPKQSARRVVKKLISRPQYTIDKAFEESVAQVDFEHGIEQLVSRLETKLREHQERGYKPSKRFLEAIRNLSDAIHNVMNS